MNRTEIDRTPGAGAETINLMDPEVQQCPYGAYAWLLENAPVYWDEGMGMFIVTGYEFLREIVRDPATFSSALNWMELRKGGVQQASLDLFAEEGWPEHPTLSRTDEPLHSHKRGLVDRVFAPGRIRQMTANIDAIAHDLIDKFIEAGRCEFMADFAIPLPCIIIASQLGVPREDIGLFKIWSDAYMARISNMLSDEEDLKCAGLVVEYQHYMKGIIDARRADPKDDIISGLIHTEMENGRKLDDSEILSLVREILVGGNETTTSAIGSGMRILIEQPGTVEQLRGEPALIKHFVEETVRLETPIQGLYRVTTRDVELGGVLLPKGAPINLRWAAGNRDECVFAGAAEMDLRRANTGSHLGFGSGIHHCLGATLARVEMASSFTAILERMEDFAYASGFDEVRYVPSILQRTIETLPMNFAKRG